MKITDITVQKNNHDRVNVMVDGKFRLSLDIVQVVDLKIKIGNEYSAEEIAVLENEGLFGKVYAAALEYCMLRPHSAREVRDYLYKKTKSVNVRNRRTGEVKERPGISKDVTDRVFERLCNRGYVDDEKFTRYWVDNRNVKKGISLRKLRSELMTKGVESSIIEKSISDTDRSDVEELQKVISKKYSRYADEHKLIQYLARQGFRYDDIKQALESFTSSQ